MSYQVLARKWRPRTFENMVGQEYILRMLGNALQQQRLHHAYLFTGTRGVGKTTLARILAKCLNCETAITSAPCGKCYACKAIDAGQFLDLFEVDAASRTKVEDTRELLENVLYPPTQGRFKIYLIDEVHMLSNHSFNALLKTLEEPPAHVKFLLATTDPKRLPITILSRCLQFHLKRMTPEQIATHLAHICQNEQITFEAAALKKLSLAADGSMRDALSLLDQAIAYGEGALKTAEVYAMLGSVAMDDIEPLLRALANRDGKQLFEKCRELTARAPDFQQLLETLISAFHELALHQIVPLNHEFPEDLATLFTPEDLQLYYQIALLGRRDLAFSPLPQQGFEMTLLRMLAFKPQLSTEITPTKTTIAEKKPLDIARECTESRPEIMVPPPPKMEAPPVTSLPEWRELLPKFELTGMAYALASNCSLVKFELPKIELAIAKAHEPMLNDKLKERMTEALSRHFNQTVTLTINTTTADLFTPVKQENEENKKRLAAAKENILSDPTIQKLIAMYDATVEVSL